ncbi:MAG: helix-turn-helix transcriptional regulator [Planctomycetes bacterium]|nr:helix-turn-helix transcriptional regulator [Planctomycetota bacterium]
MQKLECEYVKIQEFVENLLNYKEPFKQFFCIRENESLRVERDHTRPYHILYLCEQGAICGEVEGEEFRLDPGDLLWVQPMANFQLHGEEIRGRFSSSICRFHLRDEQPYRLKENYIIGQLTPRDPVFDELFKGSEIKDKFNQLRERAVIARIICNACISTAVPQIHTGLSAAIRKQAIDYIQRNIRGRFQVAEIAEHVGLNTDYFSRQFKLSYSVSPQAWIKRLRNQEAADHLLATSLSVSDVADRFGFQNVYFFSRQFKEVMHETPSGWRKTRNF